MAGSTGFGRRGLGGQIGRSTAAQGYFGTLLLRTGPIAMVRFSFWKLACKQGLPVGVGCWDMAERSIWTYGPVSAGSRG